VQTNWTLETRMHQTALNKKLFPTIGYIDYVILYYIHVVQNSCIVLVQMCLCLLASKLIMCSAVLCKLLRFLGPDVFVFVCVITDLCAIRSCRLGIELLPSTPSPHGDNYSNSQNESLTNAKW
jgi:hypothetical protein